MNFQSIEDYITQFPIYQYAFLSIDDIEFNDKVRTICKPITKTKKYFSF